MTPLNKIQSLLTPVDNDIIVLITLLLILSIIVYDDYKFYKGRKNKSK